MIKIITFLRFNSINEQNYKLKFYYKRKFKKDLNKNRKYFQSFFLIKKIFYLGIKKVQ